jgi:hypothetical protein
MWKYLWSQWLVVWVVLGVTKTNAGVLRIDREIMEGSSEDESVDVVVRFSDSWLFPEQQSLRARNLCARYAGCQIRTSLERVPAISMRIPRSQLIHLQDDDDVWEIYEDNLVDPFRLFVSEAQKKNITSTTTTTTTRSNTNNNNIATNEIVSYALPMIEITGDSIPKPAPNQGNSENCFKVCFVDGGVLLNHVDIVSHFLFIMFCFDYNGSSFIFSPSLSPSCTSMT